MSLLLVLPGRYLYYHGSGFQESTLALPQTDEKRILWSLEETEESLALAADASDGQMSFSRPDLVLSETESFADSVFWKTVFQKSCGAGSLLVHQMDLRPVFPEFFTTEGRAWNTSFVIHYTRPFLKESPQSDCASSAALVFANPAGEPLAEAAQEAERVCEILSQRMETRLILRGLSEFEFREEIETCRALFYFGHARYLDGCPIIPFEDADRPWAPLLHSGMRALELLVLNACLPGLGRPVLGESETVLYPICRLADRKSAFVFDFAEEWAKTRRSGQAFLTACRRDEEASDIRRYVFRLSGQIQERP